jgi:hypothetical protein
MIPQDRGGGGYRYQMVNIREANILWREMQTARSGSAANPRFKGLKCLEIELLCPLLVCPNIAVMEARLPEGRAVRRRWDSEFCDESEVKGPTQAKGRLEWATRPVSCPLDLVYLVLVFLLQAR